MSPRRGKISWCHHGNYFTSLYGVTKDSCDTPEVVTQTQGDDRISPHPGLLSARAQNFIIHVSGGPGRYLITTMTARWPPRAWARQSPWGGGGGGGGTCRDMTMIETKLSKWRRNEFCEMMLGLHKRHTRVTG